MFKKLKSTKGFTLIEVLLVVAIIAILAGIVILAINPNKQLGDTRNANRKADVNTIINAIYQYSIDNQGNLPASITALAANTPTDICQTGSANCATDNLVDLSVLTNNGTYVVKMPSDPKTGTADDTHYQVERLTNNRIEVIAPDAEGNPAPVISVER